MGYSGAGKTYGTTLIANHFEAVDVLDVDTAMSTRNSATRVGWLFDALTPQSTTSYVVVDSIRTPEEATIVESEFARFTLLYIRATRDARLGRLQTSETEDADTMTKATLEERDRQDAEVGLNELLEDEWYDATIGNDLARHFERKLIGVVDGYAASASGTDE